MLLPHQFNDGRAVPKRWHIDAIFEIAEHFGGVAHETQKVSGIWRHQGATYREKFTRLVVDVLDKPENRQWLRSYKNRWRARLQQIELYMVSYRIEIE